MSRSDIRGDVFGKTEMAEQSQRISWTDVKIDSS